METANQMIAKLVGNVTGNRACSSKSHGVMAVYEL